MPHEVPTGAVALVVSEYHASVTDGLDPARGRRSRKPVGLTTRLRRSWCRVPTSCRKRPTALPRSVASARSSASAV